MDAARALIFMFCCSICCSPVLFYICFLYVHARQAVLRRWIPPGRVYLYAQMRFPVTGDKSNLPNNIISNHIPNIPGSCFWPWAQHWGLNHIPPAPSSSFGTWTTLHVRLSLKPDTTKTNLIGRQRLTFGCLLGQMRTHTHGEKIVSIDPSCEESK